jgi:hypothetical protein
MEKCIICGCIKDGAEYIENIFKNIEKIQSLFNETKIIIAYDISKDNTLEILEKLQKKFDLTILINKNPLSNVRTINIENARNSILNVIYKNYINYDYFIMMDLDDVCCKKINLNVIKNGLNEKEEWDALFFNNENYYDFWALSFDNFQYSCWHTTNCKKIINIMNIELKNQFNKSNKYISCYSAFGGFGIYKLSKFINCQYKTTITPKDLYLFNLNSIENVFNKYNIRYTINDRIHDCEHRYFHLSAINKNNARLKISKQYLFPKYIGSHTDIIDK